PFPANPDPALPRFVAKAQDWVALVYVPPEELAAPSQVRVELFEKGKKKDERTLLLRGRLGQAITATKSDGTKVQVGLLAAAVSPDGRLIALLSGRKLLVFREEEFLGAVESDFFPAMVLTRESLLWCAWAHRKGEPLLVRWGLDPSENPEALVLHGTDSKPGKKLLAVRSDGLLWLVDAFTGEPWLLTEHGAVKQRFAALKSAEVWPEKGSQRRRELEESLPWEAHDATRRPPKVELLPVGTDPWVTDVYAMGNDLLVVSEKDPDRLYWFADDARDWQCLQLPFAASEGKTPSLTVGPNGFWVSGGARPVFFSAADLYDRRRQTQGQREKSKKENTTP
ncbi:MAG: hypothetical protein ACK42L_10930, partial [Thermoanaerobaculum sp.]